MAILETKDLRKIYGSGENEVRALEGVSISVDEGEFVAVVGTSGSGKSTLLNMIGGLDRPTSGSVTIRGKELLKMKDEELTIFRRRKSASSFKITICSPSSMYTKTSCTLLRLTEAKPIRSLSGRSFIRSVWKRRSKICPTISPAASSSV